MVVRNDLFERKVLPAVRVEGALFLLGLRRGRGLFEVEVCGRADGPSADEVEGQVGRCFAGGGRGAAAALETVSEAARAGRHSRGRGESGRGGDGGGPW